MSDLISRKALIEEMTEEYKKHYAGTGKSEEFTIAMNIVNEQPVAYDIDKVVKRLENQREGYRIREIEMLRKGYEYDSKLYHLNQLCFEKAIDIVRKGGVE